MVLGDFISSYKGHTIFALFLSLLLFLNPISIALAIIGANFPDFDHKMKNNDLYKMLIVGLILFIALYIAKLPYFIGIIICILPIIFYFSNHRGFTHSIFGIIVLSTLTSFIIFLGIYLISPLLNLFLFSLNSSNILALTIIIMGLAIISLNKKLLIPFLFLFSVGILFLLGLLFFKINIYPMNLFNSIGLFYPLNSNLSLLSNNLGLIIENFMKNEYVLIFLSLFLGFLSHLILDSLTPAGIQLFRPFSSINVGKKFAVVMMFLLGILAIFHWGTFISLI